MAANDGKQPDDSGVVGAWLVTLTIHAQLEGVSKGEAIAQVVDGISARLPIAGKIRGANATAAPASTSGLFIPRT